VRDTVYITHYSAATPTTMEKETKGDCAQVLTSCIVFTFFSFSFVFSFHFLIHFPAFVGGR